MVIAPESAPPNPLSAVDLAQESLGEWLNQSRQLQVGEWVLIESADGQKEPLKLAWVATDRAEYVFVNRKGLKAVSLGPVEVAERLRESRSWTAQCRTCCSRCRSSWCSRRPMIS